MPERTVSPEDLARLKREREQADRRYNDALTAVDRAIQAVPDLPSPTPAFDEHQITPLNQLWNVLPENGPDLGTGWRGRLGAFVWRIVGPIVQRQQEFNAALVDHINRNVPAGRETGRALDATLALLHAELAARVTFQSRLIQYLQQITPYVDTKDREVAGLMRRLSEDASVLGDDRVQWLEATLGMVQQRDLRLKRELERLLASARDERTPPGTEPRGAWPAASHPLDSYKYVSFERLFRGSEEEIRRRLEAYAPCFAGASDVLDVGCGRGEFLDVLRARGVTARGVDVNHEMVEACRARGLEVAEADAVAHLEAQPDGALGGLFAAQVVEHFEPAYLLRFLELAFHKLRPGATIVLETINVTCWSAFFGPYLHDITHVRPLPPDTLAFLLRVSGFQRVEVRRASPVDERLKLQPIAPPAAGGRAAGAEVDTLVQAFNDNVARLNDLLFTYLDYAAIAQRPAGVALDQD